MLQNIQGLYDADKGHSCGMPVRIVYWFAALLVLANAQNGGGRRFWDENSPREPWKETSNNLIDIDLYNPVDQDQDGAYTELPEELSGSGSGDNMAGATDDEDLLNGASGSGSGAGVVPDFTDAAMNTTQWQTTPRPTSPSPRTPCEQLRETSKHLFGNFVPRCMEDGNYDSLQCRGAPGTGTCWCADLGGREIPGTALSSPSVPDCERGSNLPPCIFQLVKHSRSGLLGTFRPMCTLTGEFETRQCKGSMCYCVNKKDGVKIPGTEVYLPEDPECENIGSGIVRTTTEKGLRKATQQVTNYPPTTTKQRPVPTQKPEVIPPVDTDIDDTLPEDDRVTKRPEVPNETGDTGPRKEPSSAAHVMTQPGILAAIIGGSVVFLLCAVLLIMFIVYRMRKKDEGSYALDEPKKMPNYSYQRAPDREFYA